MTSHRSGLDPLCAGIVNGRLKVLRDEFNHRRNAFGDTFSAPAPGNPIPGANLTATECGFRISIEFDDISEIPQAHCRDRGGVPFINLSFDFSAVCSPHVRRDVGKIAEVRVDHAEEH